MPQSKTNSTKIDTMRKKKMKNQIDMFRFRNNIIRTDSFFHEK